MILPAPSVLGFAITSDNAVTAVSNGRKPSTNAQVTSLENKSGIDSHHELATATASEKQQSASSRPAVS